MLEVVPLRASLQGKSVCDQRRIRTIGRDGPPLVRGTLTAAYHGPVA